MIRIAIAGSHSRRVGGIESYVEEIATEFARCGNEVAHFSEYDLPADRPHILWPAHTQQWCIAKMGEAAAIAAIREWGPDIIYSQGLLSPKKEAALLPVAPVVFCAHVYHGTCISGSKTQKFPKIVQCERVFGWKCLVLYYPRRCGGLNPITALREYRIQAERLSVLPHYQAIVTSSAHMRNEYLRHGFDPDKVVTSNYLPDTELAKAGSFIEQPTVTAPSTTDQLGSPARLLFIGRLERLKGGLILLDALPMVVSALNRPIKLVFGGDGLDRALWEGRANAISANDDRVSVVFEGWLNKERIAELQSASDLLVVPSLWPEPFGKVGPDSGLMGLPAAAFAVGGIREWLYPGVNGYLAPASPPTARGLADAIVKCLQDSAEHQRLRAGALAVAQRFDLHRHVCQLSQLFEKVADRTAASHYRKTAQN